MLLLFDAAWISAFFVMPQRQAMYDCFAFFCHAGQFWQKGGRGLKPGAPKEATKQKGHAIVFLFAVFFLIFPIMSQSGAMDVDFDVPRFLMEERKKAPASLQHYFSTFEDLYERK